MSPAHLASSIAAVPLLLLLTACSERAPEGSDLNAEIRWTSYGIPHVKADSWAGLGYGFAYATAKDAVCVIARDVVMVNGELSRHFGPDDGNVESDIFHDALLTAARIEDLEAALDDTSADFSRGYVAGYNRYLADHATSLPASCAGEPWVTEISTDDLARLSIGVGIRYGLGRFAREMASAAPPDAAGAPTPTAFVSDFEMPVGYGSNAVALGRAVTESGKGVLFGNPHYPWSGSSRFHLIHTTIPGEIDVMGVSLYTTTRVAIGFNADVAWSHTVSTALRSTLYELELDPENPLRYRYGDEFRPIEEVTVPVAATEGGTLSSVSRKVYFTHYGPVVASRSLPWDAQRVYTVRDANLHNTRELATYGDLNAARSIDDVEAAISQQGAAWTNTVAADRHGTAFYADISVTPNVDEALIERCRTRPAGVPASVVVLNGSDPDCEWRDDPRSAVPGAMPPQDMPRLRRDDYVSNSNDSYWLTNPAQPLEGYSPIIGQERSPRSLRTRAGLTFIGEAIAAGKVGPDTLQEMFYSQRNFAAELLLDDVLGVCVDAMAPVLLGAESVDVSSACKALASWDRRNTVTSRGGHVWREFWRHAQAIEGLYAVPFDPADPVSTPRGIALADPLVRARLLESLARATRTLDAAGIAPDAVLGKIQYAERDGERIPVPGGEGWAGMWSMIVTELDPEKGYTPIIHGNSYVQVISWDAEGRLDPRAILTYSQSPEPESPHYADMTRLYAQGQWVRLPFSDAEIDADPNLVRLVLSESGP